MICFRTRFPLSAILAGTLLLGLIVILLLSGIRVRP